MALQPYLPPSSAVLIVTLRVDTIAPSSPPGSGSALVLTLYLKFINWSNWDPYRLF